MIFGICIFTFAVLGIAYSPLKYRENFFYLPVGIVYFIILTSSISNFLNVSTGNAAICNLVLAILILVIRLYRRNLGLRELALILKRLAPPTFFMAIFYGLLISYFAIDFAGRNFDAHYAIVDGIFLGKHPANSSLVGSLSNELIPMDWSASTNLRYGMSFIISYFEALHVGNPWINAQYIFFALLGILLLSIYSFVHTLLKRSTKVSILVAIFASLSPLPMLNINYFMFGQTLALPVLIFSLAATMLDKLDKTDFILHTSILLFFFVAYPAMLFPAIAFYFLSLAFRWYKQEQSRHPIKYLLSSALIMSLITFGFDISTAASRLIIWITSNLNPQSVNLSTTESIPITIFSQFTSQLALPLTWGLLPYPFLGHQSIF